MTWKAYFVDALGAMALGLFASLLIGTIFQTLGDKTGIEAFVTIAKYAKAATGAAIAVAIAYKLKCEGLVLFSAIAVGIAGNELGGPMGAYVAVIVAAELGKIVYKETQVDILVTPAVVIISGVLMAYAVGAPIQKVMTALGTFIENATQMQPFLMGKMLMDLGFKPGKQMGEIIKQSFELQLDGKIKNAEEAIAWVQSQTKERL